MNKHLKVIKDTLRRLRGANQTAVIAKLNPIIRGWSQYFCTAVSRKVFEKASHQNKYERGYWSPEDDNFEPWQPPSCPVCGSPYVFANEETTECECVKCEHTWRVSVW